MLQKLKAAPDVKLKQYEELQCRAHVLLDYLEQHFTNDTRKSVYRKRSTEING